MYSLKYPRKFARGYATSSIPPTMSTMKHPWKQNPNHLENSSTQHGPWNPSKYPDGAIFKDADPLPYLKYKKRVKQTRFPAEFGRLGRPDSSAATPRSLFPHTHVGVLRGVQWKNPFKARAR